MNKLYALIGLSLLILIQGCPKEDPAIRDIAKLITPVGTFAVGTNPTSIAAGDFNGDQITDLLTTNVSSDSLSMLLGNGDGTFQETSTIKMGNMPRAVVTMDFDGDGHLDLALANAGSKEVIILLGNGNGTFRPGSRYATRGVPLAINISDFNSDQKPDLAIASKSDSVLILLGSGDATFEKKQDLELEDTPTSIAAADLNHDGIIDLAVANNGAMSNNVSVFLGNGDGAFRFWGHYPTGMRPLFITAGDFTGDGHPDLEVVNGVRDSLSIFLGKGDGTFMDAIHFGAGTAPASAVTLDINEDGYLDTLVVNNLSSTLTLLLGKGDGTFRYPPIHYQTERGPFTIIHIEFTHGGRKGLAVANNANNSVSIYSLNQPPRTLTGRIKANPAITTGQDHFSTGSSGSRLHSIQDPA